jgi:CheY-like chemotaxis protein
VPDISGLRIMVVEDEFWVAEDMARVLTEAGVEVIGPIGNVTEAIQRLRETQHIDAAVLDINLLDVNVYPLAEELVDRGVPFIFTTGYDIDTIPVTLRKIPRIEKPAEPARIIRELAAAVSRA